MSWVFRSLFPYPEKHSTKTFLGEQQKFYNTFAFLKSFDFCLKVHNVPFKITSSFSELAQEVQVGNA